MRDGHDDAWAGRGAPPLASDHPHQQQINALIALVAALLGALRAKGAMGEDEIRGVLRTADAFLPEGSKALGLRLLAVVREAGDLAASLTPPGSPLDRGGGQG
ncbi:hypothetical protein [Caldovatus aquaticus]|uniref:Uncharacterized protein n=1 Tax=Caldovatus aquaticus TaxID=2865671 RepID=A0ABS7F5U1_9PROT|nr:hypothetical protein [Caldovatus aquaticus]MBW8270991.1 hypothetical protein [Caldovatus aquaticus]